MIRNSLAAGVFVAAELVSACSGQPNTVESELPTPIVAESTTTTTPEVIDPTTTTSTPEVAPTTLVTETANHEQTANEKVQAIFEDYIDELACATRAVSSEQNDDLGRDELGDLIHARTDKESVPPNIEMSKWLVEEATDRLFIKVITHEIVHACSLGVQELSPPITLPSGDEIIEYQGFTVRFDAINIAGKDISETTLVEEGAAAWITAEREGGISGDKRPRIAIYGVTAEIIEESGLSLEEVAKMASEGDMSAFFSAYYGGEATPTQMLDMLARYEAAWFGRNNE